MDDDLLFGTAARLAALIRRRRLSPVELMRAVLARADAVQPRLNPFAALLAERAMDEARAAEQTPRPDLPLHGVPVSIKDQVDVGGVPTTHGSAIHAGEVEPPTRHGGRRGNGDAGQTRRRQGGADSGAEQEQDLQGRTSRRTGLSRQTYARCCGPA